MAPETYQLADLTSFIRRVLALNLPEPVWVAAELAQANASRGHYWLTLVQKNPEDDRILAQLEGVVWGGKLTQLRRSYGIKLVNGLFQQGMSVRLRVSTTFHERYGLRLTVEDIDPSFTLGELERRRQETLKRLAAEGLLAQNASVPLPLVPQRLAIISSETAAGLADFQQQLTGNTYGYHFKTKLFSAAMQGVQSVPEITARLREVQRNWAGRFDAIVLIRGGGSRMDLVAFDDEHLCRAVAECTLPVLAGVGHETDDSVLDRVAHRSLKTPTAVAAFLVDRAMQVEGHVLHLGRRVAGAARQIVNFERPGLERLQLAVRQTATATLTSERVRLERLQTDLNHLPQQQLHQATERLSQYERLLTALRPETTLARGFALVSQDGKLVLSPDELTEGVVNVRLRDGVVELRK